MDGGKSWKKMAVTATNGLPRGTMGRIGLDWSRSNPNVVYAFYDNYACDTRAAEEAKAAAAAGRAGRGTNPGGSAASCPIIGNEVYRSNDKGESWTLVSGQTDEQRTFMKGMSNTYACVFGNICVYETE